jgi:sugar diacid utilization regulator
VLTDAVRALPGPQLAIGTAGAAPQLAAVHAERDNARYAAEVAAAVPAFGRAADWDELGSYAVFQYLPRDQAAPERICPGVTALLTERSGMYEATVRAYLDCGANAQQTAALLHIHRTTLYWRLARVADLLAADLSRGDDRLKLHLALKLAELTRPR